MKNNIVQIIVAVTFVVLLALLSDPFMLWMPEAGVMAALLGVAILACVWAAFVMYERAADEREEFHRMQAGRVAYLSGVAVLTVALVVQGLAHDIDPWVSAALAVMITAKLGARIYASLRR